MVKLTASSPCAGLLPLTVGALTVRELDLGMISSVAPYPSSSKDDVSAALGMDFPAPLSVASANGAQCIWVGRGEALLTGLAPSAQLAQVAAVVDQSDAWAVVSLTGSGGAQALARLVPIDMRLQAFAVGATARTQVGHMNASITRTDEDSYMIAVFRSMAGTLVHELHRALEAVAARG